MRLLRRGGSSACVILGYSKIPVRCGSLNERVRSVAAERIGVCASLRIYVVVVPGADDLVRPMLPAAPQLPSRTALHTPWWLRRPSRVGTMMMPFDQVPRRREPRLCRSHHRLATGSFAPPLWLSAINPMTYSQKLQVSSGREDWRRYKRSVSYAHIASSTRFLVSSFVIRLDRCALTVLRLM